MLRAMNADGESVAVSPADAVAAVAPPLSSVPYAAAGRYAQKRLNVPAIAVTVGLHVALIAGLASIHYHSEEKQRQRLVVVDLRSPPPPPPPPSQKVPQPKPAVVAPTPKLQLSRSPPTVITMPDPVPVEEPVQQAVITPPAPPAPPAPPSTITSSDLGTRMVSGTPPRYPIESRRKREQGTVLLALILGTDGRVESVSIARSSGFERLDTAARNAVRTWRWSPTTRDGQAVKVKGVVEIPFVLQG